MAASFIGRNLVERIVADGHYAVTLFNRGATNPELFAELPRITGDRNTADVAQLADGNWDYVIDLSCFFPDSLEQVLQHIGEVHRYVLLSSCSAYNNDDYRSELKDESAPLLPCDANQRADTSGRTCGHRKAECERVLAASGLDHVILRPALVYGPFDPTDRFYYWAWQVRHAGELLLPDGGINRFSMTYVDDLVNVMLQSLELTDHRNIYNMISRPQISIEKIVACIGSLLNKTPTSFAAPAEFLRLHNVSQWLDMPLWIDGNHFTYTNTKLLDDFALSLHELRPAVEKTLRWFASREWPEPGYGMPESRRQELLTDLRKNANKAAGP